MAFHDRLRKLRRDKGLTQHELGKLADIKTTHISRLEKVDADPKLSTIYKLMNALECSADNLLTDDRKLSVSNVLRHALESAEKLDDQGKKTIIDVIDKYCTAVGMNKLMEERKFIISEGGNKSLLDDIADQPTE